MYTSSEFELAPKSYPHTRSKITSRRHHLAGVAQEELEQRELGARELDLVAVADNVAGQRVEREVEERERGRLARRRGERLAAEQRPQPGEELLERKGLDEVVVRAGVEPRHTVGDARTSGQHEDRHLIPFRPDQSARLEAVEAG